LRVTDFCVKVYLSCFPSFSFAFLLYIMLAVFHATATVKKVKIANTRLPREGFRFLVVSLPVTYIVSHKPDDRLPLLSARPAVTPATLKRAATNFAAWMGVNSLPKTVTRQRRDCDLNPGPSAPEPSALTTRLPSHLLLPCSGEIKIHICRRLRSATFVRARFFDIGMFLKLLTRARSYGAS